MVFFTGGSSCWCDFTARLIVVGWIVHGAAGLDIRRHLGVVGDAELNAFVLKFRADVER